MIIELEIAEIHMSGGGKGKVLLSAELDKELIGELAEREKIEARIEGPDEVEGITEEEDKELRQIAG